MSKAGGVAFMVAGLAAVIYVLPSGRDIGDADFGQYSHVANTAPEAASQITMVPEPRPAVRPSNDAPISFSAPVVVTIAQRPSDASAAAPKAAPLPRDRDAIGRELQKELKRVGCYDGELNGAWTPSTRSAMKAFIDRVNATLPTDEPDSILLTMVRGYQDRVCGKPCPSGQGLSEGGRCVPNAMLVRATPRQPVATAMPMPEPAITGWSTNTTAAPPTPPPPPLGMPPAEGRMALAGPPTEAVPVGPAAHPLVPAATPPRRVEKPKGGSWAQSYFRNSGVLN